jgi:uncharacterized membrane protein
MVMNGVVVILSFGIGSTLTKRRAQAFPAMEPASTSTASSGVVALLGGVVLGCFLLWLVSSRWKHLFVYSEERWRRYWRHFLLEGVALEVMGLRHLWCCIVVEV